MSRRNLSKDQGFGLKNIFSNRILQVSKIF